MEASHVIDVREENGRQRVRTLVPQKGHYPYVDFLSDWPRELLSALAALKKEWFSDSYARFEEPNYIQKQVDLVLALYNLSLRGKRILDFGCGFGASSYCLLKRGADNIVAADLERDNTDFAKRYFALRELEHSVEIRQVDVFKELQHSDYDLIWLQAVLEHLLPVERKQYLPRFWNALRPGGILVVTETPNRLWPKETHTTGGRWWLPWMPHASVFSRLRGSPEYEGYSDEAFYRSGVIGSTYSEILTCLGRPDDCEEMSQKVRSYIPTVYRYARVKNAQRLITAQAVGMTEPLFKLLLRQPIQAFLPFLNHLAFRKRPIQGA
jgi:2-polyprenyl-3-methyl-5-hydroxy-6-metoxy-1,4-benzoquinol methylase